MKNRTVTRIEAESRKAHGPGGYHREDKELRSAQLRHRREYVKWLAEARSPADKARLRGAVAGIDDCLALSEERGKYERMVGYRQEGGDDGYHYVVRVNGRAVMSGLTRTSAEHEKTVQVKRLMEAAGLKYL